MFLKKSDVKTSIMPKRIILFPLIALCTVFFNVNAQDWPQFLGPDRNGYSEQQGILRSWPEGGPEVLWAVDVGIGYGGPVVKDGKVYLLDRDDDFGDILRCFTFQPGRNYGVTGTKLPAQSCFPVPGVCQRSTVITYIPQDHTVISIALISTHANPFGIIIS